MHNFRYIKVASPEDASSILRDGDGSGKLRILAGGTDLIPLAKEEIISPETLVDITAWAKGSGIDRDGGGIRIGALTPLSSIASHAMIGEQYTALADACRLAATPQLRNMGSIAGNLLQQTRCWYYRGPFDCWLKGGDKCFARSGENEGHAIFNTSSSPCVSAHPSDPAAALLAFDARVRFMTQGREEEISLEELYVLPEASRRTFVRLPGDAVVTAVLLPGISPSTRSTYVKAMARAAWGFALAGVAVVLEGTSAISKARVALSGLSPIPVRVRQVESALNGSDPSRLDVMALAELLVANAEPLSHNEYKVALLRGVFAEALEAVCKIS
jgi:xanthine dehydrogenase YagS FAD-binding subunit